MRQPRFAPEGLWFPGYLRKSFGTVGGVVRFHAAPTGRRGVVVDLTQGWNPGLFSCSPYGRQPAVVSDRRSESGRAGSVLSHPFAMRLRMDGAPAHFVLLRLRHRIPRVTLRPLFLISEKAAYKQSRKNQRDSYVFCNIDSGLEFA